MTNAQMSYNDFFRQFIVKLCSNLDLQRAAYQCSLFIKEIIPFDKLVLSMITNEPHKLRHLVGVHSDGKFMIKQTTDIPEDVCSYMKDHFDENEIKFIHSPKNGKDAAAANLIIMPLTCKGEHPIGFFTIIVDEELTQEQKEALGTIQESITYAVAAATRHENESKKLSESSFVSVDLVFNRLKALMDVSTDKELAQKLNALPSVIANSKVRSSIPYDKIIIYCQQERIPLELIFMHNPFILVNKNKDGLYKAVLPSGTEYIDDEKVEDLLQLPRGSLETYIATCLLANKAIPPVEKLPTEMLQTFHNTLRYLQVYGSITPSTSSTIVIPFASGALLKNKEIATTGQFFHFCKNWAERLSATGNVFAYRIADDSMTPTLLREDVVIVDSKSRIPRSNGLYAVALGGHIFIKRLMPTGSDSIIMICDNKMYPSGTVSHNDIIGKVVWHARDLL